MVSPYLIMSKRPEVVHSDRVVLDVLYFVPGLVVLPVGLPASIPVLHQVADVV